MFAIARDTVGMITALIYFIIAALLLFIVWYVIGLFIQGVPHKIIGAILGLLLLLYALKLFLLPLP